MEHNCLSCGNLAWSDPRTALRLIKHFQWLLKAEWEKVKSETKGTILRVWAVINAHRHLCRYRAFCEGEGSLAKLD
jgi:hypothetical protein